MKVNKKATGIILGVFILTGLVAVGVWYAARPDYLLLQGEAETSQVRVAAKIFGRVDSIFVSEGQSVEKGQTLVRLDAPEIEAKLMQARAARTAAGAMKEKAQNGARSEQVQTAFNLWRTAQTQADFAAKTFERIARLYADGVVPEQKKDEAEARFKAARQQAEAARQQYQMALAGARDEDKQAARALHDKAAGAVAEVESYRAETRLQAPAEGIIEEVLPAVGELVSPGYPIVTILDLDDQWVVFNLREDLLPGITRGTVLHAEIPALNLKNVELQVTSLKALGSYATWTSTKTQGDFDRKTFEIQARPSSAIAGLRPGMTVLVKWER